MADIIIAQGLGECQSNSGGERDVTHIISGGQGNWDMEQSRTIADLEGAENIAVNHLSEAVQYRRLDRNLFA